MQSLYVNEVNFSAFGIELLKMKFIAFTIPLRAHKKQYRHITVYGEKYFAGILFRYPILWHEKIKFLKNNLLEFERASSSMHDFSFLFHLFFFTNTRNWQVLKFRDYVIEKFLHFSVKAADITLNAVNLLCKKYLHFPPHYY